MFAPYMHDTKASVQLNNMTLDSVVFRPCVSGTPAGGLGIPSRCEFWTREGAWKTTQQFESADFTSVTIKLLKQKLKP